MGPTTKMEDSYALTRDQEKQMADSFRHLEHVRKVAYSRDDSTIELVVIHRYDDIEVSEKIIEAVVKSEELLPDHHYVNPWIYHESETNSDEMHETRVIFSR